MCRGFNGRTQRPGFGSLSPWNNTFWLTTTLNSLSSYSTFHSVSHNILIDTKDVCNSPGTIWACVAFLGSPGTTILHVCVDFSLVPSGKLMRSGF